MIKILYITAIVILLTAVIILAGNTGNPVWPGNPDPTRVEWLNEIKCEELKPNTGFLGKIKNLVAGISEKDRPLLPFDLVVTDKSIFMICQTLPGLIEIDRDNFKYKLHKSDQNPIIYPISICAADDGRIFFTDSEKKAVFEFSGNKINLLINDRLVRPTGIAVNNKTKQLYIIDTGDHSLKIFDFKGNLIEKTGGQDDGDNGFNFPTFAAFFGKNIWINDAMNYRIKRFDSDGNFVSAFGEEGDGPGTFSRPKGIAVDSDEHIWVVDNLFDNIQLFNNTGDVMLVIGSRGNRPGQFWSPAGIDIKNDTVYIADTFNNRIQILHYLGAE